MIAVSPPGAPPPIPLSVVTGFLGAGKTTFLNTALAAPDLQGTLVVVNEFGTAPLDQHLIGVAEEELSLLASGCLCCTIRGSLSRLLEDLLRRKDNRRMPDFARIVIETTGLADPAPVLAAVLSHPYLSRRYQLSGLVTVVDAVHAQASLLRHAEVRRQIQLADTLLVSKASSIGNRTADVRALLASLNPLAPVLTTGQALEAVHATLFGGVFSPHQRQDEARSVLRRESLRLARLEDHDHDPDRHSSTIQAFSIAIAGTLDRSVLDALLAALGAAFGPALLRLKGLVALTEDPDRPLVVHMVQGVAAPAMHLARWPEGIASARVQVIGDGLDETAVRALVAAFIPPP